MPPSSFSYTGADGTQIAAYRWDPAGEPRGAMRPPERKSSPLVDFLLSTKRPDKEPGQA